MPQETQPASHYAMKQETGISVWSGLGTETVWSNDLDCQGQ
jgi:hypothetical protein